MCPITDPGEEHFKDGTWGYDTSAWIKLIADSDGHLQIDTLSTALPTGAATAANQTTIITALQLIDDLRGALDSVNTDELVVNVDETVLQATLPAIYNVTMTLADTEYNQALPSGCRKLLIKCRTHYDIKLSYAEEESPTPFITIPAGMAYNEDLIHPATMTIYFQCATAGQIAEIVAWS